MKVLRGAFAIIAGLVLAWGITLVVAEVIRTLLGPRFAGVAWPAWFPTTPLVVAALVLWTLIARAMWRMRLPGRGSNR